ncbi:hypothetical protein ANO14919_121700 [Xylariales sp. No.14919]|nr:hypothetical protein ANO14919_121700 [Xylariales sp. No.14919]
MSHSPTVGSSSIATPQLSSSRPSLDSLLVQDEGVTAQSNDATRIIRPGQKRWLLPFSQARSDLRRSNLSWKLWVIMVFLAVGFKLTISLLLFTLDFPQISKSHTVSCDTSGLFNPLGIQPNRFAFSQFFQINRGLGHLTFTQAKVIDTFWDLVVGRGGQACLALVSWRLFADCATVSLVTQPLSFAAFRTIFLESEPSIFSTWTIAKSFIFQKRVASKFTSGFIIFDMVFILAWPTLISAATGYVPITWPVIREQGSEENPNLIAFSRFRPIAYIIHDFWRINGLNTSLITCDDFPQECVYYEDPWCTLLLNVSAYTSEYGFYSLSNRSSQFMGMRLEPPTLDIEAYYITGAYNGELDLYGLDWTDPRNQHGNSHPFSNSSRRAWEYLNKTYLLEDINSGGSCAPETDMYRWGASYLQLVIVTILLSVWALGTFLLWLFYHLRLQAIGKSEAPRGYQALEILTSNVSAQLQKLGFKLSTITDRQARQLIKKTAGGGSISFKGLLEVPPLRSWIRTEWPYAFASFGLFSASLALYLSSFGGNASFIYFDFTFATFIAQ